MNSLLEGYRRFRATGWPEQRRLYEYLAEHGQRPRALVIACVDSRADPARIFDAAPGELLVVRNVANLVPPYAPDAAYHGTSAAIEFGIRVLGIPQILVMGHGECGGVKALLEGAPAGARDFVAPWMSMARPAREHAERYPEAERQHAGEQQVVRLSIANLLTFPWIADAVRANRLTIQGAWFAIRTGTLALLGGDGRFHPVDEEISAVPKL